MTLYLHIYTIIAESITSTAQQVLCKKAMKNNSDKLKDEYRKVYNLIRRSMKKAKEDWLEQQCKEIYYDLSRGINSKKAYTTLKLITNSSSRKKSIIKDKTGTPLTNDKAKMERWTEYCK